MSIIANEKTSKCLYIASLPPQERCEAIADLMLENEKLKEQIKELEEKIKEFIVGESDY